MNHPSGKSKIAFIFYLFFSTGLSRQPDLPPIPSRRKLSLARSRSSVSEESVQTDVTLPTTTLSTDTLTPGYKPDIRIRRGSRGFVASDTETNGSEYGKTNRTFVF